MKVFNLSEVEITSRKNKVLQREKEFNTRIVELGAGGEIPECEELDKYVLFIVLEGQAVATVDGGQVKLASGNMLTSEDAKLGLRTEQGVRMLGIQIEK